MREYKDLENLSSLIDISAVICDSTIEEIDKMVLLNKKYNFICAFALPCFTSYLKEKLKGSKTLLGGTVGFPSGSDLTATKVDTAKKLINIGCDEIDMVINVGALKSKEYDLVYNDIKAVVDNAGDIAVKSIIEIAYLSDDEIRKASELAVKAGVTFVKTGTGWANKPTTPETIRIIKETIGNSAKIKAAGGVRDLDTLYAMIDEGCSRFGIGLNSAVKIMEESYKILGK